MKNHKLVTIVGVTLLISAASMTISKINEIPTEIPKYKDTPFGIRSSTKYESNYFRNFSKEQDFILGELHYIRTGILDNLDTKYKYMFLKDSRYENIGELFTESKKYGVLGIIYIPEDFKVSQEKSSRENNPFSEAGGFESENSENLENNQNEINQHSDQIIETLKNAYIASKKHKTPLGYSPTKFQMESEDTSYLKYSHFILIRTEYYQKDDSYKEAVTNVISKLKEKNPNIYIMVQVSVHPPGKSNITADEIINQIESIKKEADGVFLQYIPSKETKYRYLVLSEVMYHYRGDIIQKSVQEIIKNNPDLENPVIPAKPVESEEIELEEVTE